MKLHRILAYAILAIVIMSAARNYRTLSHNISFAQYIQGTLAQEQAKNKDLKKKMIKSQDAFAQEAYTRDVLGLQKEGETVLKIPQE